MCCNVYLLIFNVYQPMKPAGSLSNCRYVIINFTSRTITSFSNCLLVIKDPEDAGISVLN